MKTQDQEEMELIVNRITDFFLNVDLSLAEWAKVEEPDYETIPKKGTRHPSTRGERRKVTAHAKTRYTETIHTRELRKYPYSLMLGKGKKHDHVWIDEPAWVEIRTLSRMDGRERDFLLC